MRTQISTSTAELVHLLPSAGAPSGQNPLAQLTGHHTGRPVVNMWCNNRSRSCSWNPYAEVPADEMGLEIHGQGQGVLR
jgi:hypothetical protein